MEVILLERVEKLGAMGEIVKVKPGYARNYLLPQKKAQRATKANLVQFEAERTRLEGLNAEKRTAAEVEGKKVDGTSIILVRQAGEAGQLYGSVSARDVAEAISESGTAVDRTQVRLEAPIKTIGLFTVGVSLHPELTVSVTVNVARSADEAKTQAKTGQAVVSEAERESAKAAATPELEEIFDEVTTEINEEINADEEGDVSSSEDDKDSEDGEKA